MLKNNKLHVCFIVCWFGELPDYFSVWLQTVKYNEKFDFIFFTDANNVSKFDIPENVKIKQMTLPQFIKKAERTLHHTCDIKRPYRICDYRPMFGKIFSDELVKYDFWGYCDLDLVFGKITNFIDNDILAKYDAIFNGGHFTLIRNSDALNNLYKNNGATFKYTSVIKHDAIFAFDEITGIQKIARKNNINAKYMIPYVDCDVKYTQLRSVMDKSNPDIQAFYWEKGKLYRVKIENNTDVLFSEVAYIHLQKRKILLKTSLKDLNNSFWITPDGFDKKEYLGKPSLNDIKDKNPFSGKKIMKKEKMHYKKKKFLELIRRKPYQVYVRLIQEIRGINKNQGSIEEVKWEKF